MFLPIPYINLIFVLKDQLQHLIYEMDVHICSSIASSAPLRREAPCNSGYKVVTNNFNATKSGPKCVETIKKSWAAINRVASQGEFDWEFYSEIFTLCQNTFFLSWWNGMAKN